VASKRSNTAQGIPQASFTAGEISPLLYGRIDFEQYYKGLRTCKNFIVTKYGGADNRPGTEFVAALTGKVRFIPFQFNESQQYVIVLGDYTMQVVINGALAMNDSNSVIVVNTPWAVADLFKLKYIQSADVITVCHPDYPTYQINRLSETSWTITPFANVNGPFRDINIDENILVSVSDCGVGSGTTVTATADIFTADMVGLEFYIQASPNVLTASWEVNKSVSYGDIVLYGNNYYQAGGSGGTTGTIPPTHTEGSQYDGFEGVLWIYLHSGFGIVKITGFTSAKIITGIVLSTLPNSLVTSLPVAITELGHSNNGYPMGVSTATATFPYVNGQAVTISGLSGAATEVNGVWRQAGVGFNFFYLDNYWNQSVGLPVTGGVVTKGAASYLWALPAWGSDQDYPGTTTYFQDRQLFARTNGQPATFWGSRTDGFIDFGVGNPALDDDAIIYKLLSDKVNEIKHFLNLQYLLLLTTGGIWMVQSGKSGQDVLTGTGTLDLSWQGDNPACDVPPLKINNFGLFVSELGNEVRTLGYSFSENAFVGTDITIMSHHLLQFNQIVDWTYQRNPYSCIWAVRDDGELLGCTFFPEQQINAWHHHDTQGTFESACCIIENNANVVYFSVKRTMQGQDVWCIERMMPRQFKDQVDAYFLDCALTFDGRPSTPANHFSGASHLAGMTVVVHAGQWRI
jgi:hypothetical protein